MSTTYAHLPKKSTLFLSGTTLIVWCALVVVSILVAWGVGGSEFKDTIFGNVLLGACLAGVIVGALLAFIAKRGLGE